jgi:streptomycin 3"-adenylyltransferase
MIPRTEVDHAPGVGQRWPDVDPDVTEWVESIVAGIEGVLGERLVGVYLHGSLATGCYYRPKSDLDLLAVGAGRLDTRTRRALARTWLEASDRRPTVGDLEVSALTLAAARDFVHPSPFEVHFGGDWADTIRRDEFDYGRDRTDEDLAAHCTMMRARGIRLAGLSIAEVFGPVRPEDYAAAIGADLDWILETSLSESPVYGVLNACRVLMVRTLGAGVVPNKEEAALWALGAVPEEHHSLIRECVECYRSHSDVTPEERRTHGHAWEPTPLAAFAAWCRAWR